MSQKSYIISHPEYMHIHTHMGEKIDNREASGLEALDAEALNLENSNLEASHLDAADTEALYGCNQDWYRIEWRRRAGCGPVAATNILMYLRKRYDVEKIPYFKTNKNINSNENNKVNNNVNNNVNNQVNNIVNNNANNNIINNTTINEALAAMNDVFTYVRPKRRGLHTVKKFVRGMSKFGHSYGLSFWYQYLLVPPQAEKRPYLNEVAKFIEDGICNDVPIAFLNLDAGDVEAQLSSWHWVTVIGMTVEDDNLYTIHYYDQSKRLNVDLGRWLSTTESGGGFAYFCRPSPRADMAHSVR